MEKRQTMPTRMLMTATIERHSLQARRTARALLLAGCLAGAMLWSGCATFEPSLPWRAETTAAGGAAEHPAEMTPAARALAGWTADQPKAPLLEFTARIGAATTAAQRAALESTLLEILDDSAATREARDYALRNLALVGGEDSVVPLANLLATSGSAELARAALERMPGAGEDGGDRIARTLRWQWLRLNHTQRIGVITTLGERGDRTAARLIAGQLNARDEAMATAAAGALGKLGTPSAQRALRGELRRLARRAPVGTWSARQQAVADALLAASKGTTLTTNSRWLLEHTRETATAWPARGAALSGLAGSSAPASEKIALLADAAQTSGPLQSLAIALLAPLPEGAAGDALARAWKSTGDPAALVALGARHEPAASEALRTAVREGVSLADAAQAATLSHDVELIPLLLQQAAATKGGEQDAVREALLRIEAPGTAEALIAALRGDAGTSATATRAEAARALAGRTEHTALPVLLAMAQDAAEPAPMRLEAIRALPGVSTPADIPQLIDLLPTSSVPRERAELERVLAAVGGTGDGAKVAADLLDGLRRTRTVEARNALMLALARTAAPAARSQLVAAANNSEEPARAAALRALGEFPSDVVAADLLQIARRLAPRGKAAGSATHTAAVRAYLELIERRIDARPAGSSIALLHQSLTMRPGETEKKRILGLAGRIPSYDALALARELGRERGLDAEAAAAVLALVPAVAAEQPQVCAEALNEIEARAKASGGIDADLGAQLTTAREQVRAAQSLLVNWAISQPFEPGPAVANPLAQPMGPELPDTDVTWQRVPVRFAQDNPTSMPLTLDTPPNTNVVYMRTRIYCEQPTEAVLHFGASHDQFKVWLGEELLHTRRAERDGKFDIEPVGLKFAAGWNTLQVKLVSWGEPSMFLAWLSQGQAGPYMTLKSRAALDAPALDE